MVTTWFVVFVIRTSVVLAMSKPRLTIASCVSNLEAYEACVLESISFLRGDLDIDILPIYNFDNLYSASMAANLALEICKTRYLMFVHQDVKFLPGASKSIVSIIKNADPNIVTYGAAGVKEYTLPEHIGQWGTKDSDNSFLVGQVHNQDNNIIWDGDPEIQNVQSVDEVLMIIDKNSGLRFDPTWPGYHLYGLDFCLQARSAAFKIAAMSIPIQHCGQYSASIYKDNKFLNRLVSCYKKWGLRFTKLCAPYCQWENGRIVSYLPFALKDQFGDRIEVPRISVTLDEYSISPS